MLTCKSKRHETINWGGQKKTNIVELDISILLYKRISADTSKHEHDLGFNRILKILIWTLLSVLLKSVSEWKNEHLETITFLNSLLSIL